MRIITQWLGVTCLVLVFLLPARLWAAPVQISVNTTGLIGTVGQLAFDFIDGGTPGNSVIVSGFASDGTLGSFTTSGSTLGQLPAGFTQSDVQFFNEYLQNFIFGSTFSFLLDITDNPPDGTSFPDAFTLLLLDAATGQSLIATSDPTGANSILQLSAGIVPILELFSANEVQVSATQIVPEPNIVALVIVALVLTVTVNRRREQTRRINIEAYDSQRKERLRWFSLIPTYCSRKSTTKMRGSMVVLVILFSSSLGFAADVTSTTEVKRSGLILNRATNSFDSVITLTNIGQLTYASPLKLVVLIAPTSVSLSNGTGVMTDGRSFIEIPLPNGQLNQGQSVRTTVKINNVPRTQFTVTFAVDASIPDTGGLPPDPGPAGQSTLLGIDSDRDGVRDDIQRYIALTYPSIPNTVNALKQLSKTYQEMLTIPAGSLNAAKSVNDKAWRNRSCLVYLYGAIEGHKRAKALFAEQFNTIDRYRVWSKQDDLLAGQSFESPRNRSTTCDFTVVQ